MSEPPSPCRAVDFWDAWRYAQAEVSVAFSAWKAAPTEERGDLHAAYCAALDREEQAAAMLAFALRARATGRSRP